MVREIPATQYRTKSRVPQNEIAIYIHGAWTDEMSASEQLNRTAMALVINNNSVPLIGFNGIQTRRSIRRVGKQQKL